MNEEQITKLNFLKSISSEQKAIDTIASDIKTGEMIYKSLSDEDYNHIFELLYGCKLEEIEPEQEVRDHDLEDINALLVEMDTDEIIDTVKTISSHGKIKTKFQLFDEFGEFMGIESFFDSNDLDLFVKSWNAIHEEERINNGDYTYVTMVEIFASDGFKLFYRLGWTEGYPETGSATTPYNFIP